MVQFRMRSIEVPQYAVLADKCPETLDHARLDTHIAFAADVKLRIIACKMKFVFKDSENILEVIEIVCSFEVAPQCWEEFVSDSKVTIPKSLLTHIAFHTVGTARGVLFAKSEGTPFSKIILPAINVEGMIESDMVVE